MKVDESLNVTFDETPLQPKTPPLEDDELVEEEAIEVSKTKSIGNDLEDISLENDQIVNIKESKTHPLENVIEDPRTSHLEAVKRIFRYVKGTTHLGLWYLKGSDIETIVYMDSDHAGAYVDCKSTSGVCTFMGCCLTSWFSKKQIALSISTTKAKYVSSKKACQQALWMKQALVDYDVGLDDIPIMCDSKEAIDLSKNSVQHSQTKHIEIHHHFLCDNVQKRNISIEKVSSEDNIADILTKPLKREPFNYLRLRLGMMEQID
nr:copia protein [Tanacetum cinerariifolium]